MSTEPVAVIVQARMGSKRFPGKVLAPFAGSTVLQQMLERLDRVRRPLDVHVATTDLPEDDAVAKVSRAAGAAVFRGSAHDVLARFAGCIRSLEPRPSLVLRICADRPLLCPVLVDEMLEAYDELGRPDYLANNLPPSYPDGLDVELVRAACLEEANRESRDPYEREHVTPFVYRRPDRFRLAGLICPYGDFSRLRVALDTTEDHERLVRLHAHLPSDFDYRDVITVAELLR